MRGKNIRKVRRVTGFFERLVGLMGRNRWPAAWNAYHFPDCGSVHTFFTFLSLDIVFLDKGGKILKIFPSTKSWRAYWGPRPTSHCLELPAGAVQKLKWKVGDRIRF